MARFKYVLREEMVIELSFRSVCKSWLSIISEPNFIKAHMDYTQFKANKNASLLRMILGTVDDQPLKFFSEDSKHYLQNIPQRFKVVGSWSTIG